MSLTAHHRELKWAAGPRGAKVREQVGHKVEVSLVLRA